MDIAIIYYDLPNLTNLTASMHNYKIYKKNGNNPVDDYKDLLKVLNYSLSQCAINSLR